MTDKNSKIYRDTRTPNYTVEIFEDVGRAVCIGLLEWCESNPISRMPTSHYKNLESIKKELIVTNALLHYDIMKELRKEVTSPNGTTDSGVKEMIKNKLAYSIKSGIIKAHERSIEISND